MANMAEQIPINILDIERPPNCPLAKDRVVYLGWQPL